MSRRAPRDHRAVLDSITCKPSGDVLHFLQCAEVAAAARDFDRLLDLIPLLLRHQPLSSATAHRLISLLCVAVENLPKLDDDCLRADAAEALTAAFAACKASHDRTSALLAELRETEHPEEADGGVQDGQPELVSPACPDTSTASTASTTTTTTTTTGAKAKPARRTRKQSRAHVVPTQPPHDPLMVERALSAAVSLLREADDKALATDDQLDIRKAIEAVQAVQRERGTRAR